MNPLYSLIITRAVDGQTYKRHLWSSQWCIFQFELCEWSLRSSMKILYTLCHDIAKRHHNYIFVLDNTNTTRKYRDENWRAAVRHLVLRGWLFSALTYQVHILDVMWLLPIGKTGKLRWENEKSVSNEAEDMRQWLFQTILVTSADSSSFPRPYSIYLYSDQQRNTSELLDIVLLWSHPMINLFRRYISVLKYELRTSV